MFMSVTQTNKGMSETEGRFEVVNEAADAHPPSDLRFGGRRRHGGMLARSGSGSDNVDWRHAGLSAELRVPIVMRYCRLLGERQL